MPPTETEDERAAAERASHLPGERLRLLRRAGHAAADDRLRPAGFTGWPWRPGCSTTTPTPTRRSPALSSTGSRPGDSPGTTSSTTSSVYWLTGTGASAARSYWESGRAQALAAGQAPPEVKLPVGFTTFPGEIFRAPRSWVEASYPTLTYFNEAARGGHFAAWKSPSCSRARCGPHSNRCANDSPHPGVDGSHLGQRPHEREGASVLVGPGSGNGPLMMCVRPPASSVTVTSGHPYRPVQVRRAWRQPCGVITGHPPRGRMGNLLAAGLLGGWG